MNLRCKVFRCADAGELEMTQRFDSGSSRRPAVPAVPPREDQTR